MYRERSIYNSAYILNCFLRRDFYPMILVANKVDLVHLRKVKDEQGREQAASLKVSDHNARFSFFVGLFLNLYHTQSSQSKKDIHQENLNESLDCAVRTF